MEYPDGFLDRMKELLGEEYGAFQASGREHGFAGLRVNTLKMQTTRFLDEAPFSLRPVPWTQDGFYVREGDPVTRHPWYYAGLYYVQEPSAMLPAALLPVKPGDFVLDLCAAPGGKATALSCALDGKGMLLANDISPSRAAALVKNLELFGVRNAFVTSESSGTLAAAFPSYFDKILVDAPCSGEGMFRRDPAMCRQWERRGPSAYVPVQRTLLTDAVSMLRPGGCLLYSTCTFSPEENEENIAFVLDAFPDLHLVRPERNPAFAPGILPGTQDCIRLYPHRADAEGHFAALLQKEGDGCVPGGREEDSAAKSEAPPPEAASFLRGVCGDWEGRYLRRKERLYLLPKGTRTVPSLRYLRTGLFLGECKRERLEPSQALALCLGADTFAPSLSFAAGDTALTRYLKGETLDLTGSGREDGTGWCLICVDGFGLGWGKRIGGMLRNKYCPGWRMRG